MTDTTITTKRKNGGSDDLSTKYCIELYDGLFQVLDFTCALIPTSSIRGSHYKARLIP